MTFEEYLKEIHAKQYTGIDDEMPDDFDNWLEQFDVNDILEMIKQHENNEEGRSVMEDEKFRNVL